jgi:exodeoxyribonuclease V gamma subunit
VLHVHRSHRTEALVEGLAGLLAEPLDDPMQAERLLVGSRGTERWLAAELAVRSTVGVLANVEVDFPQAFVDRLVDDVLGERPRGAVDPWAEDALAWTIAGRLPYAIADDPDSFPALARYLRVEPSDRVEPVDDAGQLAWPVDTEAVARGFVVDRKLLGFATQTAELFGRYALHRPEMVQAWVRGRDLDAEGRPLGTQRWQASLWRAIAAEQPGVESSAARTSTAIDRLAGGASLSIDVPPRLLAFGVSTLPPLQLELLAEVARQREVHLFVPSPSPALWRLGWEAASSDVQPANALLRSAGRVGRHAAVLVREAAARRRVGVVGGRPGEQVPTDAIADRRRTDTLLARLQRDVAADRPLPTGPDAGLVDRDDRSVVFHDGHGAVRQVEALQDELLRRFDADPTLHPRDVVVLTPDLRTHAPLVRAVFADPHGRHPDGRRRGADPPTIPVAVGDRGVGRGNPVAAVLQRLLALVHARASGAEVLDLLSSEPVRTRFRVSPAELATVQRWIEDTGVAWARDEADRAAHGQPARREHTWAAAVDRLLLGVAMADEGGRALDGVVPYDPIEDSGDLDLLDRVTRFLDVVDSLRELRRVRSLAEWAEELGDLLDTATGPADGVPWHDDAARNEHRRHRERVDHVLVQLERANDALGRDVEVRALARWLDHALGTAGTSPAGHGTGAVTVAELVPLRAIPFRLVCLLGMDTGTFPRSATPPGHDLTARDPRPGDRDRRAEDRALFLDALHAAQDALVVCYAGRDPVSGREQPPAIPVAELRDAVAAYVGDDGLAARTVVHQVLPSGPAAFDPQRGGPTSFDRVRLAAARAGQGEAARPAPFVADRLPDDDGRGGDVLHLGQLTRVLSRPAQGLLDRLRVARPEDLRSFPETEPLQLDALQRWQLGTALLDRADEVATSGRDWDDVIRVELARGRMPAGALGRHEVRDVVRVARGMVARLDRLGPREDRDVTARVAGTTIEGRVRLAVGERTQLVETWYGTEDGKRHLRAWLRHLVAQVHLAEDRPRSVLLFRSGSENEVDAAVYPSLPADVAADGLRRWVELYERCRHERVPFVPKVSWQYALDRRRAERLAATADGVDLADVEGLSDAALTEGHGDTGRGRNTVARLVRRGVANAHRTWGRDDGDARAFPERDGDDVRVVFRDVLRWEELVARTDLLPLAIDLLRPLADAVTAGEPEAEQVCA